VFGGFLVDVTKYEGNVLWRPLVALVVAPDVQVAVVSGRLAVWWKGGFDLEVGGVGSLLGVGVFWQRLGL
jgi:hypothetical protein